MMTNYIPIFEVQSYNKNTQERTILQKLSTFKVAKRSCLDRESNNPDKEYAVALTLYDGSLSERLEQLTILYVSDNDVIFKFVE